MSAFKNLAMTNIEVSELAKFNLKNFIFGNLPYPLEFGWEKYT